MIKSIITITAVMMLASCASAPPIIPEPILINCEYKTYPIIGVPMLSAVKAHRLDDPGVIAGLTQEDIDNIGQNILRLVEWGDKNAATIAEINKLAVAPSLIVVPTNK